MEAIESQLAELVDANRILANEDVLDAFGHVSVRLASDPGHYRISRSISPELVTLADIQRYDLTSNIADADERKGYSERVIHGEIYAARQDVGAICHLHAPGLLPFCITGVPLVPVTHLGATVGPQVPLWNSQDQFGDTDMLVSTREQGASLARALGGNAAVLLKGHGAVVVGKDIRSMVMRTIQLTRNAEALFKALQLGKPEPLTAGEIKLSGAKNLEPAILARAWDYWAKRAGRTA